jgi:hypothetical protein
MSSSSALTIVQDHMEDEALGCLEAVTRFLGYTIYHRELAIKLCRDHIEHFMPDAIMTPLTIVAKHFKSNRCEYYNDAIKGLIHMSLASKDFRITDRVRQAHCVAIVIEKEEDQALNEHYELARMIWYNSLHLECRGLCDADMRSINDGLTLHADICTCHWCFECYDRVKPWLGERCLGCNASFEGHSEYMEYKCSNARKALIEELMVDEFEQNEMVVDEVFDDVYAMVA